MSVWMSEDPPGRWGMPPGQPWPHQPGPHQPGRPQPGSQPRVSPLDGGVAPWLEERMFAQRVVLLQGPVGAQAANNAAAMLLALDGLGSEPVRLHVNAPAGELDAVFAVVDAIDVMRAPVHATVIGQLGGAAVGVYAAAHRRLAYPHARFHLAEPGSAGVSGTADQVTAAAGRYLRALEDLVVRVAEATGQPRNRVEDDFGTGRIMDAVEAHEYGLVDEILPPNPR